MLPHRLAAILLALTSASASAQILAHPGWTRSGFAAEPWYQRAVFYEVRTGCPSSRSNVRDSCATDFKALAERLDAMQSTGIDAVIVTPPALPSLAGGSAPDDAAKAIAAQAALDAFDNFTRQATARGIRVLAALPATHADADLSGRARFWLTRGVAGLRLEIPPDISPQDRAAIAASVRSIAASVAGQRIVLVDGDQAAATNFPAAPHKGATRRPAAASPQLQVATLAGPLTAAALRPQLARAVAAPDTLLDSHVGSADSAALAKVFATLALTTNAAALADPAQPLALPATQAPPEPEDDSAKPAPAPIPPQPPPGVYLPYVPYVPPARPRKEGRAAAC